MIQKTENIIEMVGLNKVFKVGEQEVQVLKDVNLKVKWGDFVIIIGPSGSGKSTILYSLLGLEVPSSGKVLFMDSDIYDGTNEDYRSDIRKKHIGMVYQQSNWIKALSVKQNVAFPMLLLGQPEDEAYTKALELLEQVGMRDWADYRPTELSVGQQQRVSIARALVNNPQLIVADEPTGNLDYQNGQNIMQLLSQLSKDEDKTIVMVTHDLEYLSYANTAIHVFDGTVAGVYTDKGQSELLSKIRSKKGIEIKDKQASDNTDPNKNSGKDNTLNDKPVSASPNSQKSNEKDSETLKFAGYKENESPDSAVKRGKEKDNE